MAGRKSAAESRVVAEVEKIAFGVKEAEGPDPPRVSERFKALEWLGRYHMLDPAERQKQDLDRRRQELAERKQEADERQAAARQRAEETHLNGEGLHRVQVQVVGPAGAEK